MKRETPSVFISYSHDSPAYVSAVANLAERLEHDGIHVEFDGWIESPPAGWPAWMHHCIEDTDFTLVICSEAYKQRFELRSQGGRGAQFEGSIITLQIYEQQMSNTRFIPVLLNDMEISAIPAVLSSATHYRISPRNDGYEDLYARIRGMGRTRPVPGQLRPPRSALSREEYESQVLPTWDPNSKGLARWRTGNGNLPKPPTEFIGRTNALEETRANIRENRTVTLTAPAGTGKTRLALATATTLASDYAAGAWWVELASVLEARELPHTLAQALGIFEQPAQATTSNVVAALRDAQLLLVLDNCERLSVDIAQLVDSLNQSCPGVRVLATSREALGAAGERVQVVRPLAAPPKVTSDGVRYSEAGALFLSRARRARPGFSATEDGQAAGIAQIIDSTLGVALAIELAAGALASRSIDEIASGIATRVRLLGASERQRVLEAVIDWCHRGLDDDLRQLWERLSVFEGGFDQADVEGVYSGDAPSEEVSRQLDDLVARGLVVADHRDEAFPLRYRLLESLRYYGRQRLVELETMTDLRERHAEHFLELARRARPELRRERQQHWLRVLDAQHDNMRTALGWWLQAGNAEGAMLLAGALGRFWHMRGYWLEGRRLLLETLTMTGAEDHPQARAGALVAKGHLAYVQAEYVLAKRYYDDALALRRESGDEGAIADSLHRVGCVAEVLGNYQGSQRFHEEALEIALRLGAIELQADVLHHLGVLSGVAGRDKDAENHLMQSLVLRRSLKDHWGEAWSLIVLGNHYRFMGELDRARERYVESLELYEDQGDRRRIASALMCLADIDAAEQRLVDARAHLARATRLVDELGDQRSVAEALESWAVLAAAQGQGERCYTLLGAAEALRERISARRVIQADRWLQLATDRLAQEFPLASRVEWQAAGSRMHPRQAVEHALAEAM